MSDRHQLYQHFSTLGSVFEAKRVSTVYTLRLVDGVALKYAALAHEVKLYVLEALYSNAVQHIECNKERDKGSTNQVYLHLPAGL